MPTPPAPRIDELTRLQRLLTSQQHLVDKLKVIRALHITAYNSKLAVAETAPELYYAIGDVLEGVRPEELTLNKIDRDEFLKELTDG